VGNFCPTILGNFSPPLTPVALFVDDAHDLHPKTLVALKRLTEVVVDDLEPRLTRSGYDVRSLAEQFDAKPAEIRRLLRGDLDPARSRELMDEMRAAGLPT
jgi:hypothetical protein